MRQEPDALDFNADHDAVFDEPTLSLAHIMDIAGIFHALDNIEKRMLSQLVSFQYWKKPYESSVNCFHRVYLRKRFKNQCLVGVDTAT